MPTAPAGTPGLVGWNELHAGDGKQALDWYAAMFGWTQDSEMDMGPMGKYRMYGQGDKTYGGMFTKSADMPMPST